MISGKLNYLNVGCGKRYHSSWNNIDILPADPGIKHVDGRDGFPFADASMQVVYHSHVLEHIPRDDVKGFLQECNRVLVSGGILRVVVPDLEQIARNYIQNLDRCSTGKESEAEADYQWSVIELLDQLTREKSGGEMLEYLKGDVPNKAYILARNGEEVRPYLDNTKKSLSFTQKLGKFGTMTASAKVFFLKKVFRSILTKLFPWSGLFKIGEFRAGGEVHKWMYDRVSLKILLESFGFEQVEVKDANTSNVKDWESFELDSKKGVVFKPDSLFVEAIKG
jgi:predicted SAM-dependent methyltransferase